MKTNKIEDHSMRNLVFAIVIIILFAFSVGAFVRNVSKSKIQTEYSNGFTFTKNGNFWYTKIINPVVRQEITVDFRYPPSGVKNITVIGNPKNFFNLLKKGNLTAAYITFDFKENATVSSAINLAAADLAKFLKVINGVTLVAACTSNTTETCHTRPIVTCQNQNDLALVIYVKESEKPSVSMNKNCLIIEGKDNDLIRAYTKLLFTWYSIL